MAARLIAEAGPIDGQIISLTEDEEWTFGRDPDLSTIVLEDATVSREHLRIRLTTGGYLAENLSETNPTLLNGQPMATPHLLEEGDLFQVGLSRFQYTTIKEEAPIAHLPQEEDADLPLSEEGHYETFYEEVREEELPLTAQVSHEGLGRWLVKVVSGPNTGAELSLHKGRPYLLGTDAGSCDIVFHDLSVSRQHARLWVSDEEELSIEDLHSRNGVAVNGQRIAGKVLLQGNSMVALGTTHFIVIDREGAAETVISTLPPAPRAEPARVESPYTPSPAGAGVAALVIEEEPAGRAKPILSGGTILLIIVALSLLTVVVVATLSLFTSKQIEVAPHDANKEIQTALKPFPGVRFSFNPATGNLFLMGNVLTPVDKSELLYNLQGLTFVVELDDNIVVDQYIWQETNQLLGKNPDWTGVSMYATEPGHFVIRGYLQTRQQAASLADYLRLSFPYVDQLENQVVVEEVLMGDIESTLQNAGLYQVTSQLSNGDLALSGTITTDETKALKQVIGELQQTPGVRTIRNFVVVVQPQNAVVNISDKYRVTGYSTHENATVNVLINGQILSRGDLLDGMTIVSITCNAVYLEKDGMKYKIDYSQ
jgi:type III secretion system YscD/HrpQ family protein